MALALLLGLGSTPTAACTWVPPSLEDVAGETMFIFTAQVTDAPSPRTYVLETIRAFRGSVPETITFSANAGTPVSSCEASLEEGSTYLFGVNDFDDVLGIGEVWLRIGEDGVDGSYLVPPTDAPDELFGMLLALPDTAMAPPTRSRHSGSAATLAGLALLTAAAAMAAGKRRRHPLSG